MTAIITVCRYLATSSTAAKRGYRWTCNLCDAYGIHRFDRMTDWVLAHRGRTDEHPWQRAMQGAERHVRRHHPDRIPARTTVQVNVYLGGRP